MKRRLNRVLMDRPSGLMRCRFRYPGRCPGLVWIRPLAFRSGAISAPVAISTPGIFPQRQWRGRLPMEPWRSWKKMMMPEIT